MHKRHGTNDEGKKALAEKVMVLSHTAELSEVVDQVNALLATRQQLKASIVEVDEEKRAALAHIESLRQEIVENPSEHSSASPRRLVELRVQVETLDLRLTGFSRKLDQNREELLVAKQRLKFEHFRWVSEVRHEFEKLYRVAAANFNAICLQAHALSEALGDQLMAQSLQLNKIFYPGDPLNLIQLSGPVEEETPTGRRVRVQPLWMGDPASQGIFEAHRGTLTLLNDLNSLE